MKKLTKKLNLKTITTFEYYCRCLCDKFMDNYTATALEYNRHNDPPMPLK
ncbi:hypothetical protein [Abyssisolibacter fermentans]|nr:hypothetical protein [Abyssisolibacter fermentans]